MTTVLWILGIALVLFFIYVALMNWAVFVNNHILKRKWTSAVPLIGGIAGGIGVALLPIEGSWRYAWIPLLVDWGSIPVIVVSFILSRRQPDDRGGDSTQSD